MGGAYPHEFLLPGYLPPGHPHYHPHLHMFDPADVGDEEEEEEDMDEEDVEDELELEQWEEVSQVRRADFRNADALPARARMQLRESCFEESAW